MKGEEQIKSRREREGRGGKENGRSSGRRVMKGRKEERDIQTSEAPSNTRHQNPILTNTT